MKNVKFEICKSRNPDAKFETEAYKITDFFPPQCVSPHRGMFSRAHRHRTYIYLHKLYESMRTCKLCRCRGL